MKKDTRPNIPANLLWEFDYAEYNFKKSYKTVIERVLERGNIENWREMIKFYSKEQILETIEWSDRLPARDKEFSRLFIYSDMVNAK